MIWHNGATGGYSAFLAIFPGTRRAVAVLANISRASDQQRIAAGLARWQPFRARRPRSGQPVPSSPGRPRDRQPARIRNKIPLTVLR